MRLYFVTLVIVPLLVGTGRCFPQGILNLNSESANLSGYSQGEPDALTDWPAYFGSANDATCSGSAPEIGHDGICSGGAVITVKDTNALSGLGPIQGKYNASLAGSSSTATTTDALGQTGTIPVTVQSLVFSTNSTGTLDVSFNGRALSLVDVSNAMNYTVYKVNFPAYAGQTGQLLFTPPKETVSAIDNQYSASITPDLNAFDCQP